MINVAGKIALAVLPHPFLSSSMAKMLALNINIDETATPR